MDERPSICLRCPFSTFCRRGRLCKDKDFIGLQRSRVTLQRQCLFGVPTPRLSLGAGSSCLVPPENLAEAKQAPMTCASSNSMKPSQRISDVKAAIALGKLHSCYFEMLATRRMWTQQPLMQALCSSGYVLSLDKDFKGCALHVKILLFHHLSAYLSIPRHPTDRDCSGGSATSLSLLWLPLYIAIVVLIITNSPTFSQSLLKSELPVNLRLSSTYTRGTSSHAGQDPAASTHDALV